MRGKPRGCGSAKRVLSETLLEKRLKRKTAYPGTEEVEEETLLERILDKTKRQTSLPNQSDRVLRVESCDLVGSLEDHAVRCSRMSKT